MTDIKLQDMKMADQIAGHENQRREIMQFYNSNIKNNILSKMITATNQEQQKS